MDVNEVLALLEDPQSDPNDTDSNSNSRHEDFEGFTQADVFLQPPQNCNIGPSDIDSASSDEEGESLYKDRRHKYNRMRQKQLLSNADIRLVCPRGQKRIYTEEPQSDEDILARSLPDLTDDEDEDNIPLCNLNISSQGVQASQNSGSGPSQVSRPKRAKLSTTVAKENTVKQQATKTAAVKTKKVPSASSVKAVSKKQRDNEWMIEADLVEVNLPWNPEMPHLTSYSPVTLFEMLFDRDVIELIIENSISYAHANNYLNFTLNSNDVKAFVAILLISGYNSLPRQGMYWSSDDDIHNSAVTQCMSKNRYEQIMQHLHFVDNTNLDSSDKFAKVTPLLELIRRNCLWNFIPEQTITADESMLRYYGFHGCKQFIRGKPIRFGYKMWVLATPSGYVVNFFPYQGAGTTDKSLGLGGSVISTLVKDLPKFDNTCYHVVFDNLFTSIPLLRYLKEQGIAATGTLRIDRDQGAPLPHPILWKMTADEAKKAKKRKPINDVPRGSYEKVVDRNGGISVVRWKDNKVVTMASTYCGAEPVGKCVRYSKEKHDHIEIDQPKVVNIYNNNMGGVDRFDQNFIRKVYETHLRSRKWYWPFFRFVIDLCVQNAWQIYRKQADAGSVHQLNQIQFRREIVKVYVTKYGQRATMGRPTASRVPADKRVSNDVRYDTMDHMIQYNEKNRKCAVCKNNANFICKKCDVGLHPKDCFEQFHTE